MAAFLGVISFTVWELVDRYKDKGLIKGYILYDLNSFDNSINLATVYAGLKKAIVEYGGGYYYPDLFAKATPKPEKMLREYAAMINVQMKKTGTKVFGFICR